MPVLPSSSSLSTVPSPLLCPSLSTPKACRLGEYQGADENGRKGLSWLFHSARRHPLVFPLKEEKHACTRVLRRWGQLFLSAGR